jgi:hypothetical protein
MKEKVKSLCIYKEVETREHVKRLDFVRHN